MSVPVLIDSEAQALSNIDRFNEELRYSGGLQDRLSYARAWYSRTNPDGSYTFGPSKFIGYRNLATKDYLKGKGLDGRQTESRLKQWFVEIGPDHVAYEELSEQLHNFLARYGKAPSVAARINISIHQHDRNLRDDRAFTNSSERVLGDLLIAVIKRLPIAEQKRVREAI